MFRPLHAVLPLAWLFHSLAVAAPMEAVQANGLPSLFDQWALDEDSGLMAGDVLDPAALDGELTPNRRLLIEEESLPRARSSFQGGFDGRELENSGGGDSGRGDPGYAAPGAQRLRNLARFYANVRTTGADENSLLPRSSGFRPEPVRRRPNQSLPGMEKIEDALNEAVVDMVNAIVTPSVSSDGLMSFNLAGLGDFTVSLSDDRRRISLKYEDVSLLSEFDPHALLPTTAQSFGANSPYAATLSGGWINPDGTPSGRSTRSEEARRFTMGDLASLLWEMVLHPLTLGGLALVVVLQLVLRLARRS